MGSGPRSTKPDAVGSGISTYVPKYLLKNPVLENSEPINTRVVGLPT